jgi:adenine phosphoribosyltransferase
MDLRAFIRDIPDFPEPGVIFRDITPLLQDHRAFQHTVDEMTRRFRGHAVDAVVAIEARGFILGAPVALGLQAAFVPVRKKGKLPSATIGVDYSLEYGKAQVEMHQDGLKPGARAIIVDDVLATGGTMAAARALVERAGGTVAGAVVLVELEFLKGRQRLKGLDVVSLLKY